ncbi:MAG: hypothetical protein RL185_416 [Bacteroidota bacterium]|jgi:hypothetical protein
MHNDLKLFKWAILLLLLPLALAFCGGDKFRYPCQDPQNWDKDFCKPPICDVTRTCPEHIFKGQRDPRLGPPKDGQNQTPAQTIAPVSACVAQQTQGANCGK